MGQKKKQAELILHWITSAGLLAVILKHPEMGHLCGYVSIPKEHPWYGKNYYDCTLPEAKSRGEKPEDSKGEFPLSELSIFEQKKKHLICSEEYCQHTPESIIDVHGGITFSDIGYGPLLEFGGDWWFGFDCAHAGDVVPGMLQYGIAQGESYKDVAYVKNECESLANQLILIQTNG